MQNLNEQLFPGMNMNDLTIFSFYCEHTHI